VIALLGLLALLQGRQPPAPPRMVISIRPETVTVGDPFVVGIRIRAARGSSIEFPTGPDSGGPVEMLDPRVVAPFSADSAPSDAVDEVARYRMAAWETGPLSFDLGPASVRTPNGVVEIPVGKLVVIVQSVLPSDTTLWVPKPARDIFGPVVPWWWPWLPILVAVAVLGGLLWWWWRRRRRRLGDQPAIDPYDLAEREFARIEALGLLEAGERGRFVALMVEVLRDYLAARVATAHPSLTSTELLDVMRRAAGVPVDRLTPVLSETDLIKFAKRPVSAERAREIGREARAIVHELGKAEPAQPAAQEAA
jgi:membrane protein implicated in regulation of membrane protease activity